jgi:hypothetical protein
MQAVLESTAKAPQQATEPSNAQDNSKVAGKSKGSQKSATTVVDDVPNDDLPF